MKPWLLKMGGVIAVVLLFLAGVEHYAVTHDDSGFHRRVDWFFEHADDVEGLIFGPSLLVQGIDPARLDRPVASLALSASGPDVDTRLLRKALRYAEPEFVLFDLTTGILDRRKTPDYYSTRKLFYFMGVWHEGWQVKDAFFADYPLYRYFFTSPNEQGFTERGWTTIVPERDDFFRALGYDKDMIEVEPRLMGKMRKQTYYNDADYDANRREIREVIELCRERGIRFILLSPPKYELWNNNIGDLHRDRRAAFLEEVVDNETVFFWDYGRFGETDPTNFRNINHLSPKGAILFTEELNRRLFE